MIRINLLPFRAARKKENVRQQISIFLLSFLFVSATMFYYNMILNSKAKDLSNKIAAITKETNKYTKINKEITSIKKKLGVLKKKTNVIKNLEVSREESVRLLDAMTNMVIEKQMWLTSLKDREGGISIKGIALDNKTVANFMTRLENSKLFKNVTLKITKQKKFKKTINLKSFEITCERAFLQKETASKAE
ncbi:MAG: PilN domain-containing protein [Deltaproteobacteria bacterium]|nr:PilN domain-containing protein [Deltaproteobacteria bacterium]